MLDEERMIGEGGHLQDHNLLHAFYNRHDHSTPDEGSVLVWSGGMWTPMESVQLSISTTLPAASEPLRGKMVFVAAASGSPDEVYICKRLGDDSYAWVQIA